jgi:hypothetical protein
MPAPRPALTLPAAPVFSGDADPVADPVSVTGPPALCGTVLKYTVGNGFDVELAIVLFVLTVTIRTRNLSTTSAALS